MTKAHYQQLRDTYGPWPISPIPSTAFKRTEPTKYLALCEALGDLTVQQLESLREYAKKIDDHIFFRMCHSRIAVRARWRSESRKQYRNTGGKSRNALVGVWLYPYEKEALSKAAKKCDMSMAEFVRMAIENEIAELSKPKKG